MQVKIAARHGHLSDATQTFIREKAEKLLHFFDRLTYIEVMVDLQNELKTVEFVVKAEHKHEFVARESANDIIPAVDKVMDKLERQINKYKEKIQDHRRQRPTGETPGEPTA